MSAPEPTLDAIAKLIKERAKPKKIPKWLVECVRWLGDKPKKAKMIFEPNGSYFAKLLCEQNNESVDEKYPDRYNILCNMATAENTKLRYPKAAVYFTDREAFMERFNTEGCLYLVALANAKMFDKPTQEVIKDPKCDLVVCTRHPTVVLHIQHLNPTLTLTSIPDVSCFTQLFILSNFSNSNGQKEASE